MADNIQNTNASLETVLKYLKSNAAKEDVDISDIELVFNNLSTDNGAVNTEDLANMLIETYSVENTVDNIEITKEDFLNALSELSSSDGISETFSLSDIEAIESAQAVSDSFVINESSQVDNNTLNTFTFDVDNLDETTTSTLIEVLENIVEEQEESLSATKDNNGVIANAWDWLKNKTGIGAGSDKSQDIIDDLKSQIEELKSDSSKLSEVYKNVTGNELTNEELTSLFSGEVDFSDSEVINSVAKYQQGQSQVVNTVSSIASGVTMVGLVTAGVLTAPFTAGASLAGTVGLIAAGTAAYMVPQVIDGVTEEDGYSLKEMAQDTATGVINSTVTAVSLGIGGAAKESAQVAATNTSKVASVVRKGTSFVSSKTSELASALGATTETAAQIGTKAAGLAAAETASVVMSDGIAVGDYLVEAAANDDVDFSLETLGTTVASATAAGLAAGTVAFGVSSVLRPILTSGSSASSQVAGRLVSSGVSGAAAGASATAAAGSTSYLISCSVNGEEVTFDDWLDSTTENMAAGALTGFAAGVAFEAVQVAAGTPAPDGTAKKQTGTTEDGLKYTEYLDKDGNVLARDVKVSDLKSISSNSSELSQTTSNSSEMTKNFYEETSGSSARTVRFSYNPSNVINENGAAANEYATVNDIQVYNWADNMTFSAVQEMQSANSNVYNDSDIIKVEDYTIVDESGNPVSQQSTSDVSSETTIQEPAASDSETSIVIISPQTEQVSVSNGITEAAINSGAETETALNSGIINTADNNALVENAWISEMTGNSGAVSLDIPALSPSAEIAPAADNAALALNSGGLPSAETSALTSVSNSAAADNTALAVNSNALPVSAEASALTSTSSEAAIAASAQTSSIAAVNASSSYPPAQTGISNASVNSTAETAAVSNASTVQNTAVTASQNTAQIQEATELEMQDIEASNNISNETKTPISFTDEELELIYSDREMTKIYNAYIEEYDSLVQECVDYFEGELNKFVRPTSIQIKEKYQANTGSSLNSHMRENDLIPSEKALVKQLNTLFDTEGVDISSTNASDGILYRGVRNDCIWNVNGNNVNISDLQVGDTFIEYGFTSTSISQESAEGFMGTDGYLLKIIPSENTKLLDIGATNTTGNTTEKEVLIRNKTQFEVVDVDGHTITLKIQDDSNPSVNLPSESQSTQLTDNINETAQISDSTTQVSTTAATSSIQRFSNVDEAKEYLSALGTEDSKTVLKALDKINENELNMDRLNTAIDILNEGEANTKLKNYANELYKIHSSENYTTDTMREIYEALGINYDGEMTQDENGIYHSQYDELGTITGRAKGKDSTYSKLKNKMLKLQNDLPANAQEAKSLIGDAQGTRLVINSSDEISVEAFENNINFEVNKTSIMEKLPDRSDRELFAKYLSGDTESISQEQLEQFAEIRTEGLQEVSYYQTQKVVDGLSEAIRSGKIRMTEIHNYYGKDGIPYLSKTQLAELDTSYNEWYEETSATADTEKSNYKKMYEFDKDLKRKEYLYDTESGAKFYKKLIQEENPIKENGYTACQFNLVNEYNQFEELQFRGSQIDKLAEFEHIVYDIKSNKETVSGSEYDNVRQVIKEIENFKEQDGKGNTTYPANQEYNEYFNAIYKSARAEEIGANIEKPNIYEDYPLLKEMFSEDELYLISVEGLEELHNKIQAEKKLKEDK